MLSSVLSVAICRCVPLSVVAGTRVELLLLVKTFRCFCILTMSSWCWNGPMFRKESVSMVFSIDVTVGAVNGETEVETYLLYSFHTWFTNGFRQRIIWFNLCIKRQKEKRQSIIGTFGVNCRHCLTLLPMPSSLSNTPFYKCYFQWYLPSQVDKRLFF